MQWHDVTSKIFWGPLGGQAKFWGDSGPPGTPLAPPLDWSIPFSEKDWIILELSELRVVAFAQFAKKSEKTIVTLGILRSKNLFLVA